MNYKNFNRQLFSALFSIIVFAVSMAAQTNEFTYQGKLSDSGTPSATYDFEFRLCDSETNCTTPLQTKQRLAVSVSSGAFTVKSDFDQTHFNGDDRWLEIAVKRPDQANYTTLAGRQKITSAPYSVRSKSADEADNAAQLGGVNASEYVTTAANRMNLINKLTRYVAFDGGANANCTFQTPCRTLSRAVQVANAGDTIFVLSGLYPSATPPINKAVTIRKWNTDAGVVTVGQ